MCRPFWAMSTSHLGGASAGVGIAVINAIGNLGGFCGPYILGAASASTGDFKSGLLVLAVVIGMSGALILLVRVSPTAR